MYEFLKKLFGTVDGKPEALTAEQLIQKLEADKNIEIVNLKDGGYVPKADLDAKETELTGVKKQLTDANKEIQSYKDMDVENIKKSAEEWKTKYDTETKALNDKLASQERSHQADMFFSGYKFTSKAAQAGIRMEFDKKDFKLENGVFQGASDYMKQLMENEDYKGAFIQENRDEGGDGSNDDAQQDPLPVFAAGTAGAAAGPGENRTGFGFGFTRLREPDSKA